MKDLFKPEDFPNHWKNIINMDERIACKANEKLNKLIELSPMVYAEKENQPWHNVDFQGSRFKAHLMFIENIIKIPCKHEPMEWDVHWKNTLCKKCGVEIFQEWKEK